MQGVDPSTESQRKALFSVTTSVTRPVTSSARPEPVASGLTSASLAPFEIGEVADDVAVPWTPPSWEEVVEQHSARVYRLAYRLTGNPHDAEDLTHDVFIRVFRSLHSYQPGTFEGWLHRITTNVFLDKMRRKQRIRFDALLDDAAGRLPSREKGPEQTYHDTRFDDDVQKALDALAPDFRAAVVLCDIEGLSYEEISATLGVKLGTVRSRIHRGRAQLREALAHRAPETVAAQQGRPRSGLRMPHRRVATEAR